MTERLSHMPVVAEALDRVCGPVTHFFEITQTPEGGAPQEIKEQWIGVSLPLRELHVSRMYYGYIGRRFMSIPEDYVTEDAVTGQKIEPRTADFILGPAEVRGYDAVKALYDADRHEAAEFWTPFSEAVLSFAYYEGRLKSGNNEVHK